MYAEDDSLIEELNDSTQQSWQAASCSAIQKFPQISRKPEGSLPWPQKPVTFPYPEWDQFTASHRI